ncbi:MAG: extracellular solute-binding protein [Anaerolineae bacterium]|nr:extracellular solute-binding protein [Anaerolineae bacterium]
MASHKRNQKPSMLLLILTLLITAAMVAACAPAATPEATSAPTEAAPEATPTSPEEGVPEPAEPVVVTFASWVGGGETWQNLAAQFHELHPNITIEFHDVPFEEMHTKLLTQVAAGNPPDIAYMDASAVGEFALRNALVSLDDYIATSEVVDPDDYVEAFLTSATSEGHIYGLPIDAESTGLFYRTDLFEAAGITKPPETWDEFLAAAQALTIPEEKQYGFIIFAPEAAYYWYPWLWQAGGDLLSEDGIDVLWDSEEGKRAAEFYVGLAEYSPPDFYNSNSWDGRVAFAEGTVAMYVAGAWFAGTLQNEFPDVTDKWSTAPLPMDERCATTIAGDTLVIFQASQNKDAAWKWIEFVSEPENMALLNLGTPEAPTTLLPPRKSLLADPATFEANPVLEGFAENMTCAVVSQIDQPKWPEMESLLNDALARAIYGEVDAATAITEAAQEAEALLE